MSTTNMRVDINNTSDDADEAHENDSGQYEEDECEEDYKEPREEELSLLGNSAEDLSTVPVPIIKSSPSKHRQITSGSSHRHSPGSTCLQCSDVDIQIATETDITRDQREVSCGLSSVKTLCGPHPAKITLVCVFVIFVWLMAVLVMHLDKKLTLAQNNLDSTRDQMKMIQDSSASNRLETQKSLQSLEHKLGRLLHFVKSGKLKSRPSTSDVISKSKPHKNTSDVDSEHTATKNANKIESETEKTHDFFADEWDF